MRHQLHRLFGRRIFRSAVLILSSCFLFACTPNVPRQAAPAQAPIAPTPVRAAVLLPLSGPDAALGKAMLRATELATYDLHNPNFEIWPVDINAGAPDAATLRAQNIQLLIGPLTSGQTRSVQTAAHGANIPLLSFSNDPGIHDDATILLGYNGATEAQRVIDFAHARGKKNILALLPSGAYGDAIANTLLNQPLIQIMRFNNGDDLAAGLTHLSPAPQAVLIAAGGAQLPPVLQALRAAGLSNKIVQYLGTGQWDDDAVWATPELQGAWYPAADPARRQNFVRRYGAQFGAAPPRLASLAYDAVAMAAILAKEQNTYTFSRLENANGFSGMDGLFRLMPDGTTWRALSIVEIHSSSVSVIQSAPNSAALAK